MGITDSSQICYSLNLFTLTNAHFEDNSLFMMDEPDSCNPDLLGIFYSYFHNIEGPKLAVQYPSEYALIL